MFKLNEAQRGRQYWPITERLQEPDDDWYEVKLSSREVTLPEIGEILDNDDNYIIVAKKTRKSRRTALVNVHYIGPELPPPLETPVTY